MKKLLFFLLVLFAVKAKAQNNYQIYSPFATYGGVVVSIAGSSDYECINFHDTMKTVMVTDTTQIVGKLILSGTANQYVKGNGDFATFPTQVTSTSQLVNNSGFINAEVDGSVTNEIELPSQTGNSGKVLSTTGTVTTWVNSSSGTVTSVGLTSTDFTVSGSPVTTSGNITANLTTTGVATGTYDWVTVDTKGRVTAAGNAPVPTSLSSGARNFNQAYQISSTRPSQLTVSSSCTINVNLAGSSTGTVFLEISPNGSTGWIFMGNVVKNASTVLGIVTTNGASLVIDIPAGYYWRASSNIVKTGLVSIDPTFTFDGGNFKIY